MRGQATIEYLVLLVVVLIIALVIFGFMGWIPEMAGSLRERQARMYWSSMWPLAIKDYKVSNTTGITVLLQNLADSKITITGIYSGTSGGSPSPSGYQLLPGESKQFTQSSIGCTGTGTQYEISNVSITYNVVGGITGQTERGDQPIIGKCVS